MKPASKWLLPQKKGWAAGHLREIFMRASLLSGAVLPLIAGVGIAAAGVGSSSAEVRQAPPARSAAANPMAVPRSGTAPVQLAACNPCAAKKACNPCNPCNPCGAKKACNPCSPCGGANPCNLCNPCAGGGGAVSSVCVVPRLAANPCAAKKACNPCNPCGAKKACNPCNPCATKKACNPCNPCGAKKACNPCNPCGAANPCNPCGGASIAEITPDEAASVYDCLIGEMIKAYEKSGNPVAKSYAKWRRYNTVPYQSATHGSRYVSNYANGVAEKQYGMFEDAGPMPAGSLLAKDSFVVTPDGKVSVGPLFLMEKMASGFNKASQDWRYTLILPSGATVGTTGGAGSDSMTFCHECHVAMEDQDSMWFLPDEFRASQ